MQSSDIDVPSVFNVLSDPHMTPGAGRLAASLTVNKGYIYSGSFKIHIGKAGKTSDK